jgi:hypothetical protein
VSDNKIESNSTSLSIDDDGNIEEESSYRCIVKSKSRLALHGIEVPTSLFPDSWRIQRNQVKISWPFPMLIVADVCGSRDLDLNSARTQVIMSDNWLDFEEGLAKIVCQKVADAVGADYWKKLKVIFLKSNNENFLRALNDVNESSA